jgi:uncharacterized protein (TIGR03435 family)
MFLAPRGGKKSAIGRLRLVLAGGAICACASLAGGQEAAADSAFEVASVKLLTERRPIPARIEAKRISLPFTTLGYLITLGYSVKNYQIVGPDWLGINRYEVIANIPGRGTPAQLPAMFRRLLRERFRLEAHEESRTRTVYALFEDTGGHRLKRTEVSTAPDAAKGPVPPPLTLTSSGGLRMRGATLEKFADALSGSLGEPVLDMTGIEGDYDIEIKVEPSELPGLRILSESVGATVLQEPLAPNLPSGLRALGLKLATRKTSLRYIVIDHVEKLPAPN